MSVCVFFFKFQSKLDAFLVMPDMLLLPQIGLLLSSVHRSTVQRRAFEMIVAIYRQLYGAVHDPENLYQNPGILMPRTPDQVLKLLAEWRSEEKAVCGLCIWQQPFRQQNCAIRFCKGRSGFSKHGYHFGRLLSIISSSFQNCFSVTRSFWREVQGGNDWDWLVLMGAPE